MPYSVRSLMRQGSMLSLLTMISRVLGLVREMVKASLLGTSALSDAFSVAFLIPNLFRRLFAEGSISVAFIPTFREYLLKQNTEDIKEFLSCMFTVLSFFVTLVVITGILCAPLIVRIFTLEAFDETVFLTRLMFPFLAFISLAAFFQGVLNSFRIFAPSGLAPILLNLVTIGAVYGFRPFTANPARAMALGILIGGFLEAAIQFPFILKKGYAIFFTGLKRGIGNKGVKRVLRLIGPTIIGMAAYQLNNLVSTALAGNAGEGVVSSLHYSLQLQEVILGIFAVSLGTVLLPDLAEYAKSAQWDIYNERLITAMGIIALITIPITVFAFFQGEILIRLLFQTRSFGEDSVQLTLRAFTFHILGLFFIALNRILAPAFYAQSDSKSPSAAGIISFVINIGLSILLAGPLEGGGIALALSLAGGVNTALLLGFLKKNPHIAVNKALHTAIRYALKLALFSIAAILPVLWLNPRLLGLFAGRSRLFAYGLPFAITALVYSVIGLLLLIAAKDTYIQTILRKATR